ncbi:HAD family hydrolase [Cytobacillus firmus]|uniref:HAD family hydrolase n=1 Tax=Cytobacillus firmus TaxID=1399 RepID=UPI001580752B|nr:HAD family phosphatase [Cytobacillus firmus]NUH83586.1 HAD family phosphatase [Cytobacillus firmus]
MGAYAVIFDMDGVIVDSEPIYRMWNQELFQHLNISVPEEIRSQLIGGSARRKWTLIKEHCNLRQTVEDLIHFQHGFFQSKKFYFKDILFPGVRTLTEDLKREGTSIALASSSDRGRINRVITDCQLEQIFDVVVSGEEFEDSKPHPDIFLHTARVLEKEPEQCIVIEDSYNGLLAATRAGMKKIGVKHKTIPMDLTLADLTVTSLQEINLEILEKMI